ncbi:hypothetical protein HanXRQr2_Chr06g0247741 [Helianthus annuus]|uniref:Uncharacterized protein n=1 Tax=Helianthus annuus TaxID=4232 RepID=A0A9K3IQV1_HELAN|nr:hypothetical protein HanXRQr2_Chr06g0247741 [Helianthus annuus]
MYINSDGSQRRNERETASIDKPTILRCKIRQLEDSLRKEPTLMMTLLAKITKLEDCIHHKFILYKLPRKLQHNKRIFFPFPHHKRLNNKMKPKTRHHIRINPNNLFKINMILNPPLRIIPLYFINIQSPHPTTPYNKQHPITRLR